MNTQYSHSYGNQYGAQQGNNDWSGLVKSYVPSFQHYGDQKSFGSDLSSQYSSGQHISYGNHYGSSVNQHGLYGNQYGSSGNQYGSSGSQLGYGNQYGSYSNQYGSSVGDSSAQYSNNYESHSGAINGKDDYSGLLKSYVPSSQGGYNKLGW